MKGKLIGDVGLISPTSPRKKWPEMGRNSPHRRSAASSARLWMGGERKEAGERGEEEAAGPVF